MHATQVCKLTNYYLHCIRKIRNCLSLNICKLLVHTLVTVRLDYGNALLCGARDSVIRQLERVQRQAARVGSNIHTGVTNYSGGWNGFRSKVQSTIASLQGIYYQQTTVSLWHVGIKETSEQPTLLLKWTYWIFLRQFLTMVTLQRHFQ